jgi:hypothetical protein
VCAILTGADFRLTDEKIKTSSPKLCGYTIIEAGKGVDCKGDTIAIGKVYSEIASLD